MICSKQAMEENPKLCPPAAVGEQLPWFALHVRTAAEPKIRDALMQKGHTVFLPTYLEVRRYSDRLKKIDSALFPGYMFARINTANGLPVLTTPGVHGIVCRSGAPAPVDESEIEAIRRVISAGDSAVPWPFLSAGDRVRIIYGPLTGVEGFLVRFRDKERLVISVNLLQRSLSVEINRSFIKPISVHQNS